MVQPRKEKKICSDNSLVLKRQKFITIVGNNPANIYLFKVKYKNTRKRCEICSKLTIKTPERRQCRHSGVFIVDFGQVNVS